jgi:Leucine-rich repeat (LRR) protein
MFYIEGATYIYWPIDGFARTEFVRKCSTLKELPTSIDQLMALQELNLSKCSTLKELPTSIGQLTTLQQLYLFECPELKELPTSIGQLKALQELGLS